MASSVHRYLVMACLLSAFCSILARPPWLVPGQSTLEASADCHTNDELLDLCQRCAKLTKSPLAYPSCCSTDIKARNWCADFVYFGTADNDYD